jgi:hypothetical protein
MTDVSGSILDITPSPSGEGLYLNYPHMGFYDNSEFTAFISASGGFLFKADDNNLISFGQSVSGGDGSSTKSFVLKSDNVFLSGSNVNILGERFFLGGQSQFVSGSNGNIEISSSKFHVQPDGDVVMNNITASNASLSGKVTATSGEIGGFTIGTSKLESIGISGAFATSASINLESITNPSIKLRQAKTGSGENFITEASMRRDQFVAGFASGSSDSAQILMRAGSTTTLVSKAETDGFIGQFALANQPARGRAQVELSTDSLGVSDYSLLTGTSAAKGFLAVATQSSHPFASALGYSNAPTHSINFFVGEDRGSHILYDGRTGEMELSSSSFRFGRASRLDPTSATSVRIGGIDNGYSVRIGNPLKHDFIIEDSNVGVLVDGVQINDIGNNILGKYRGRNIRVVTTDGDSTNAIQFMTGSAITEHKFFDNKAQIRRQDGNHLFVSDKLEFRKPAVTHSIESTQSMFSVSDDVLLYGTSSVEPEFSITKTDDDNVRLKFELSNGNTLLDVMGPGSDPRMTFGLSSGVNIHMRESNKAFHIMRSGNQAMLTLQDTGGRPKLTLSGSMTGPDLIVSSSKMDSTSTFAHTASINHLQIGGGDFDSFDNSGPYNGSIFFGENANFGYAIKHLQGERALEFYQQNQGTLVSVPHMRFNASGTHQIILNKPVSASSSVLAESFTTVGTGSFGHVTVGGEGFVPTSTNVFQCATTAFNINAASEGSLGSVTLGTPSVENSTYITHTNNQSPVTLKLIGEYAISVDLIVDDSATDQRHAFFGYIEHQNSSGTTQYRYPIGGMYIRSDDDGYDAAGIGGQIRLITSGANDKIVVKVLVLDRENTGTCSLDDTLSRVKIDKITYGKS